MCDCTLTMCFLTRHKNLIIRKYEWPLDEIPLLLQLMPAENSLQKQSIHWKGRTSEFFKLCWSSLQSLAGLTHLEGGWKDGHTLCFYQTYSVCSGGTSPALLAEQCQHRCLVSVSPYVCAENRIGLTIPTKTFLMHCCLSVFLGGCLCFLFGPHVLAWCQATILVCYAFTFYTILISI